MDIARVIGHVVATEKDPSMQGVKLCILQPLDESLEPKGEPLIATDATSKRGEGEIVFFVASGDAIHTGHGGQPMPVDAAVMGIVDQVFVDERATGRLRSPSSAKGASSQ